MPRHDPHPDFSDLSDDAPAATPAPSIIPLERADPGWLFLIAGLVLAAATLLIPSQQDLDEVRWLRDRAVLIEQQRQHRLNNYARYIAAAERGDETVVLQLVESQLGMRPINRAPCSSSTGKTGLAANRRWCLLRSSRRRLSSRIGPSSGPDWADGRPTSARDCGCWAVRGCWC